MGRGGGWLLAVLAIGLAGCDGDAVLVVSLRTDYVVGLEVDRATTVVGDGLATESIALDPSDDLIAGRRIAELSVPAGRRRITVELSGPGGFVARRVLALDVQTAAAVTAVITRSCAGVACPSASDAAATECLGGVCVSPECTPETPESCPEDQCEVDGDCAGGGPACTSPACFGGACGLRVDPGVCEPGVCDPVEGCVGAPPPDAGTDAGVVMDAGPPPVDAGSPCAQGCPGSCRGEICVLDGSPGQTVCPAGLDCELACDGFGACDSRLVCGDGVCVVHCGGGNACAGGVDCGRASRCEVTCDGPNACRLGAIECGTGACDVRCESDQSCTEVACGPGGSLVSCVGTGACPQVTCNEARGRLTLSCTGFGSCADVDCAGQECDIDCADNTCMSVDCAGACDCDVTCAPTGCGFGATCSPGCGAERGCMSDGTGACGCPGS